MSQFEADDSAKKCAQRFECTIKRKNERDGAVSINRDLRSASRSQFEFFALLIQSDKTESLKNLQLAL